MHQSILELEMKMSSLLAEVAGERASMEDKMAEVLLELNIHTILDLNPKSKYRMDSRCLPWESKKKRGGHSRARPRATRRRATNLCIILTLLHH